MFKTYVHNISEPILKTPQQSSHMRTINIFSADIVAVFKQKIGFEELVGMDFWEQAFKVKQHKRSHAYKITNP